MAGPAVLEVEKDDARIHKILDAFESRLQITKEGETDMKPEEIKDLVEKSVAAVVATALKAKADADAAEKKKLEKTDAEKKASDEIAFEGDPTNKEDVKKHLAKIDRKKLENDVDWADTEAVKKHFESLEDVEKDDPPEDGDTEEVTDLKRQLKKAQKRSNQSSKNKDDTNNEFEGVSKEAADAFKVGREIAAEVNKSNGYKAEA